MLGLLPFEFRQTRWAGRCIERCRRMQKFRLQPEEVKR